MQHLASQEWANQIFGQANLGDPRRTRRLQQIAADLSDNTGKSIVKSCDSPASIEAVYRFIRNDKISPSDIAESGFLHTSELISQRPLVLAIQDTTELSYKHSVSEKLGNVSNSKTKTSRKRSLHVHSTIAIDAQTEKTIGLANQAYWFRKNKNEISNNELQKRQFEDKESAVWMKCFEAVKSRLDHVSNVLDVCDRGADIYEYLDYHTRNKHRFLVRAKENRNISGPVNCLRELCESVEGQCCYTVNVKQRGGRKARKAKMTLHYQSLRLVKPRYATGAKELPVNVIICQEKNSKAEEPLQWVLYTNEPINSVTDAQRLVRYYELRWRIEEFHKTWKSDGTGVEGLRLQSVNNIKRIAIIKAFIAIRLQQLQEWAQNNEEAKSMSCRSYVTEMTWQLLWLKTEKSKPLPTTPPSLHWLYYAIARLGGWYDSKRNGKVGVKALWDGWLKLAEIVESAQLLQSLKSTNDL